MLKIAVLEYVWKVSKVGYPKKANESVQKTSRKESKVSKKASKSLRKGVLKCRLVYKIPFTPHLMLVPEIAISYIVKLGVLTQLDRSMF